MRIGLDAMGGDFAPEVTVLGADLFLQEYPTGYELVLFGDQEAILSVCRAHQIDVSRFEIVPTTEVIAMGDHPAKAYAQKTDSSICVGYQHLAARKIDGFASAGSTGAMMVGAMYTAKVIPGVLRPTIATIAPRLDGKGNVLLDIGLNADCKPDVLYQYAVIGSLYAEFVYNIPSPRVGLLNIGSEPEKGDLVTKSAYQLMDGSKDFNFIGNVEGHEIFSDKADVIVTNGFVGNIVLKEAESFSHIAKKMGLKHPFFDRVNPEIQGGTPVLGIDANVIIGHGASNDIAIKNMLKITQQVIAGNIPAKIKKYLNLLA